MNGFGYFSKAFKTWNFRDAHVVESIGIMFSFSFSS